MDEIPVAERQANPEKKKSSIPSSIKFFLSGSLILFAAIGWFWRTNNIQQARLDSSQTSNSTLESNLQKEKTVEVVDTPPTPENKTPEEIEEITENILGHLPYEQASTEDLKNITSDGSIRLKIAAANKFLQMQQDAKKQGINLIPISGFRTVSEQEYLFFEIKAQRKQDASKRAEVSAPPGYSEHHTGYAIDIGDGNVPSTNLSPRFDQTTAYKWLEKNAAKYSFELSFPEDNQQGISYEPWHWRYVGDTHSLKTFYQAHNLKTN